jgi:hypothetical protein
MTTFNTPAGGGLKGLERALSLRLYTVINTQRPNGRTTEGVCASSWMSAEFGRPGAERACRIFLAGASAA